MKTLIMAGRVSGVLFYGCEGGGFKIGGDQHKLLIRAGKEEKRGTWTAVLERKRVEERKRKRGRGGGGGGIHDTSRWSS
jgi:hypothetical protein